MNYFHHQILIFVTMHSILLNILDVSLEYNRLKINKALEMLA